MLNFFWRLQFKDFSPDGLVVVMSFTLCVECCPSKCNLFWGLSLALRSNDQIPASHWSTPIFNWYLWIYLHLSRDLVSPVSEILKTFLEKKKKKCMNHVTFCYNMRQQDLSLFSNPRVDTRISVLRPPSSVHLSEELTVTPSGFWNAVDWRALVEE